MPSRIAGALPNSLALGLESGEIPCMVNLDGCGPELAAAAERRTGCIVEALSALDDQALLAPSVLRGWSRLTIACHLRYGADALSRMTVAALEGVPVAYYPGGRDQQRPASLEPKPDEASRDVVASLANRSDHLDQLWSGLSDVQWSLDVVEPDDNPDLGLLPLVRLPLLRLTEVEVHGSDLGIGLDDWSDLFVRVALPFRLDWLTTRRTNHRGFDDQLEGSWLLVATDGPAYVVTVMGTTVESHPSSRALPARAAIEATTRDLLALLLGRPPQHRLCYSGDRDFGRAFSRAFPGP